MTYLNAIGPIVHFCSFVSFALIGGTNAYCICPVIESASKEQQSNVLGPTSGFKKTYPPIPKNKPADDTPLDMYLLDPQYVGCY
jgi:hypothetical protein